MRSRIRGGNINAHTSETRYTPLHIAVKFGQSEAVRQLIAAGANIDSEDVLGQTPLGLACCYEIGTGIPRQLLDAGADKEHVDKYSWEPIFWAASKGYYDVVKLLVDRGARKNDKDKRGERPLNVASDQRIRNLLN
ncbi:ankyrin repeat-containing domain protein [Xylogone sp. PMI_703]|nr:ankyrin repeat-containing domain protein [Xylogone sp. PMI_703]